MVSNNGWVSTLLCLTAVLNSVRALSTGSHPIEDPTVENTRYDVGQKGDYYGYFLSSDDLSDGQHEMRLYFGGVRARQTSVGAKQGSDRGLVVREVSNGRAVLTLVYNGRAANETLTTSRDNLVLRDCSYDKGAERVGAFLQGFSQDSTQATPDKNHFSFTSVTAASQLPEDFSALANFKHLKKQCAVHHAVMQRTVKRLAKAEASSRAASQGRSRARRSINDLFIMPGTLWCGNTDNARGDNAMLSGHMNADACCRSHDFCPYNIHGIETKYGLFNKNVITMSHCNCDRKFRTCLKASNSGAANLVGRIFFDMVQTECFTFTKKKVCSKYNWWNKCQKYKRVRRAVKKESLPWTRSVPTKKPFFSGNKSVLS